VLDARKDKWLALFSERPDTIFTLSSKLFNYLDHNFIEQNNSLENVTPEDETGLYYDFKSEPDFISFANARKRAQTNDAIFSITPGKLVVYFFKDDWNFVCRK